MPTGVRLTGVGGQGNRERVLRALRRAGTATDPGAGVRAAGP